MDKWKILLYSLELTKHKVLSSRFKSLCFIYTAMVWVSMSSVRGFMDEVNYPISPYIYPCMIANISFQVSVALCGIYLFSDAPFLQ